MKKIIANYVDIENKRIFPAQITIEKGKIKEIVEWKDEVENYLLPGFIDAHIHIESSMMTPFRFSTLAMQHGTIATVSDPHEIANVCGLEGVQFMLESAQKTPFHFYFGAPSCVPATPFEHAGATLGLNEVRQLLELDTISYLSEMMNFPGVIHGDNEVLAKIKVAQELKKPIDGHAPQLRGKDLKTYIGYGISTDHECTTLEEAQEKLDLGMKILIREGSAAKNFEALHPLISKNWESLMFCSDDKHPDDLVEGHINLLVQRALELGYDFYKVLQIACFNPIAHYNMTVGKAKVGDPANFQIVSNLQNFNTLDIYIDGEKVLDNGKINVEAIEEKPINHFQLEDFDRDALKIISNQSEAEIRIIEALDGQLLTREIREVVRVENHEIPIDLTKDRLKIVVINRYTPFAKPITAFIKGIGLKKGAIGSCIAHDSHNFVVVGTDEKSMEMVIEKMITQKGGIAVADALENYTLGLELDVAGILSTAAPNIIALDYALLDRKAKEWGSTLEAPFMTLSFMALPVIPQLKITDIGLFDVNKFENVSIIV